MNESDHERRLDAIVTQWSLLRLAHRDASLESQDARRRLLLKYNLAIRDYTGAILRHEADADEVAQDILVRMLQGDFANADPNKGKFRHFLKTAIRNLIRTYWSKKQRRETSQSDLMSGQDSEGTSPTTAFDYLVAAVTQTQSRSFASGTEVDDTWRSTLLTLTMRALEQFQSSQPGCIYHTILKLRTDFPDAESTELADRLSAVTGKPWNAAAARQQLRRARLRFAQLLVEEAANTMKQPTPMAVEEELAELGLWDLVRPFLAEDWATSGALTDCGSDH
ncbi:MAG TPA: sigma factor [Pirellulaceae bacterium]|nr:sigma factor [Pirellulaceae bacterium]